MNAMKAIIDGKSYNMLTATKLGEAASGLGNSDFKHWYEELYRTKKGAYFLAGYGGPMTRWASACQGGGWSGSKGIRVLTEQEAREWVERYENGQYEAIFGAVPEA
jgi:hypothetical protein